MKHNAPANFRTPLGRALGLGSARAGAADWLSQRLSGLLLIPLGLWLGFSLAHLPSASYSTVLVWLRNPWNTFLATAVLGLAFFHGHLGLRVIIEDYVHIRPVKLAALIFAQLLCGAGALAAVLAVLRVAYGV